MEARIIVTVRDMTGSSPVRQVAVTPKIFLLSNRSGHVMEQRPLDQRESHADIRDRQPIPREEIRQERGSPGEFIFIFVPREAGQYELTVTVSAVNERPLEREIIIDAVRQAFEPGGGHAGGLMAMGSGGSYCILGGALMGVMMIIMLAGWGRLF